MISVCMATHNGEKYIKEQIDSILPQLSIDDELIISDDGSTDNTLNIIEQYNDPRIKLTKFIQPYKYTDSFATHRYASKNFENALSKAKGEYIFLCDQDDVWMPNKVCECIYALQDAILVKHIGLWINSLGKSLNKYSCVAEIKSSLIYNIYKLKFAGSHIAFKKTLLPIILPFPQEIVSHDAWIGCLASCVGECENLKIPLVKYRSHSDNVSVHKKNNLFVKLSYRMSLFIHIIWRLLNLKFFKNEKN